MEKSNWFDLDEALHRIHHCLPAQGPIKDFIHHNTLHAFQNLPFDDALKKAGDFYGARSHMHLDFYRTAYRHGKISEKAVAKSIERYSLPKEEQASRLLHLALFRYIDVKDSVAFKKNIALQGANSAQAERYFALALNCLENNEGKATHWALRQQCAQQLEKNWDLEINPILFRVTAGYLDQGILLWPFLSTNTSFWDAIRGLVEDSWVPLAHFIQKKRIREWFKLPLEKIIKETLAIIVGDERYFEAYMTETLMAHPGWSGMVGFLENSQPSLIRPRSITLKEFLAFKLILEVEWIASQKKSFVPVSKLSNQAYLENTHSEAMSLALFLLSLGLAENEIEWRSVCFISTQKLEAIWQYAFELTYHHEAIVSLQNYHAGFEKRSPKNPSAQLVFCIDDRECSFRRYLEESDPTIETFSTAGFFGLDFYFQSLNDAFPVKLCPAPVTPKHLVKEAPAKGHHAHYEREKRESQKTALSFQRWQDASSSMFLGFVAANTLGHLSFFWLLACLLKPVSLIRSLLTKKIQVKTELALVREEQKSNNSPVFEGFTYEEMATKVFNVLRNMGLIEFAPVVVLVAHGSSSMNNPHFAAYDCGACSGRPGAPNARVFAMMANMPQVRKILAEKGMLIPESTCFVGGYHDTCVDSVDLFDRENLSPGHAQMVSALCVTIDKARALNAKERCRRFSVVKPDITLQQALKEVNHRASVLFEPRPELNHATNALCVVGRRAFTRGLFLDRRAFLNSYDPTIDESGAILNQILNAVVPVCGGINLEYYFSRIDPAVYGCGTKLSHNVCSMLGVYNGIDDDLRTGLPVQMTEVHDPVRLLLVIEQHPHIVDKVLESNKPVLEWIQNEWVIVVCMDPETHEASLFKPNEGFVCLENEAVSLPVVESSFIYAMSSRENLPIAKISASAGAA